MPIETEIKFRVDDMAGLAERLEAAGFTLETPRAFESNVLYDTPDRAMRARTEILRIRGYAGRWTVTHKRLPDVGPGEDTHKHRIETETEVADGSSGSFIYFDALKTKSILVDGNDFWVGDNVSGCFAQLRKVSSQDERRPGNSPQAHVYPILRVGQPWHSHHHHVGIVVEARVLRLRMNSLVEV